METKDKEFLFILSGLLILSIIIGFFWIPDARYLLLGAILGRISVIYFKQNVKRN